MNLKLNIPVSVMIIFNAQNNKVTPYLIKWRARKYTVKKIGLHHTITVGKTLHHIFSVMTDNDTFFRLNLNTDTLHWILEEVSDGLTD
jgi:predicted glycoside hydrolase/deacetylase ChbG (UPF0249 family)